MRKNNSELLLKEVLFIVIIGYNLFMISEANGDSAFDFGEQIWGQIENEMVNNSQSLLNNDKTSFDELKIKAFCSQSELSVSDKVLCDSIN